MIDWLQVALWIGGLLLGYVTFAVTQPDVFAAIHGIVWRVISGVGLLVFVATMGAVIQHGSWMSALKPLSEAQRNALKSLPDPLHLFMASAAALTAFNLTDMLAQSLADAVRRHRRVGHSREP